MACKLNKKLTANKIGGFTLIELSLVIVIAGILLSFFGTALTTFLKKSDIKTTEYRLSEIDDALARYLRINGHYPCPANRTLSPDHSEFGRSIQTDCRVSASNGTVSNNGVRIGALPVRSLNLPDEFIVDAWGRKLTYAVTMNLATNGQFSADGGRISIVDGAGNSLITPDNSAHYIVISHGETGDGGYYINSDSTVTPCSVSSLDRENCNDDNVFMITLVNSESDIKNFFDDYGVFRGQTAAVLDPVPSGAVMAFNLDACPTGWRDFMQAQGRFIAGVHTNTQAIHQTIQSSPPQFGAADFVLRAVRNGDAQLGLPPYVALRYCEKI